MPRRTRRVARPGGRVGRGVPAPAPSAATLGLVVAAVVLGAVAMTLGDYQLSVGQVLATLTGGGTRAQEYVVLGLRAPRVVLALVVGAASGRRGAIFQSLARNELASPDLLGFTTGGASGRAHRDHRARAAAAAGTTVGAVVGTAGHGAAWCRRCSAGPRRRLPPDARRHRGERACSPR